MIFVFGSNLAGRHGKGAALEAKKKYGAVYGQGWGRQGNSYAIPTKGYKLEVLPLKNIRCHVEQFLEYASRHQDCDFLVTNIGCGLAGYLPEQIAPMFKGAPPNCKFSEEFRNILESM